MLRFVLSVAGGLLLSANAWALPQPDASEAKVPTLKASTLGMQLCLLLQDPWQDCSDEPALLHAVQGTSALFSDPWQDTEDPWQPFPAVVPAATPPDSTVDPWQPLISQLLHPSVPAVTPALAEDPWQPAFADPWQEGADDPWQVP
jgi:hypothetical protein